jgi:hypothetical protein
MIINKQEIFDRVAEHLISQNHKAKSKYGNCMYYSGEYKCAAGCLIPEKDYKLTFEGKGIDTLIEKKLYFHDWPVQSQDLIRKLQNIHDNFEPKLWDSTLKQLAEQEKLNY